MRNGFWPGVGGCALRRCGWYLNPTPGNLWLLDKDGRWGITSQSEGEFPDPQGVDNAPHMDDHEFVQTQPNGRGYGCACLTVETDIAKKRFTKIISGETVALRQCKNDKSLPNPTDE